jgi:hypothetical protein
MVFGGAQINESWKFPSTLDGDTRQFVGWSGNAFATMLRRTSQASALLSVSWWNPLRHFQCLRERNVQPSATGSTVPDVTRIRTHISLLNGPGPREPRQRQQHPRVASRQGHVDRWHGRFRGFSANILHHQGTVGKKCQNLLAFARGQHTALLRKQWKTSALVANAI